MARVEAAAIDPEAVVMAVVPVVATVVPAAVVPAMVRLLSLARRQLVSRCLVVNPLSTSERTRLKRLSSSRKRPKPERWRSRRRST
jgi:hypothetical protein